VSRGLAVAIAVVVVLTVGASGAQASINVGSRTAEVTFSEGSPSAPDTRIESHLVGLINRERSTIIANVYQITPGGRVDTALANAQSRGVAVYITSGQQANSFSWLRFAHPDRFRECTTPGLNPGGGCMNTGAPDGKAHSKFFLFYDNRMSSDATTVHRSAVHISSANQNAGSGTEASNNGVTYYDDPDLWWQMWSVWEDMFHATPSPTADYYRPELGVNQGHSGLILSSAAQTWIQVSPDANASTDMVGEQLAGVQGPNVTGAACRVDVLEDIISDARLNYGPNGRTPVEQLARLKREGCDVRVTVSSAGGGAPDIGSRSQAIMCSAGLTARVRPYLHDKAILISGVVGGSSGQTRVLTGSQNLTGNALLHNDELLTTGVNTPELYSRFITHADTVRGQAGPSLTLCGGD
jgi:hypothetical protein